ncbi:MAG: hypothetical protein ACJAYU_001976 [Bradymonadia bacterium]|jgi:hypothetical protein
MKKFLFVPLALAAIVSCADDATPEWVVEISASDRTLPADGSEGANITIGVSDSANGGAPAPQGTIVIMQCRDESGDPSGNFAESDSVGDVSTLTDSTGLVEYRYRCGGDIGEDYTINCIALSQGASTVLIPQIVCETLL